MNISIVEEIKSSFVNGFDDSNLVVWANLLLFLRTIQNGFIQTPFHVASGCLTGTKNKETPYLVVCYFSVNKRSLFLRKKQASTAK